MFSESMLSMPESRVEEPEPTSHWPALVAISCAWFVALVRCILGLFWREGLDFDMALTALALAAIPLAVFYIGRAEHRLSKPPSKPPKSTSSRRERPRLVLISNH